MYDFDQIGSLPPHTQAVLVAHPSLVPRIYSDVPRGWDRPVSELLLKLRELQDQALAHGLTLQVAQFKEKQGGLRVYLDFLMLEGRTGFEREQMRDMDAQELHTYRQNHRADHPQAEAFIRSAREMVDAAARHVDALCGRCGQPGELVTKGWHQVLCPACRKPCG